MLKCTLLASCRSTVSRCWLKSCPCFLTIDIGPVPLDWTSHGSRRRWSPPVSDLTMQWYPALHGFSVPALSPWRLPLLRSLIGLLSSAWTRSNVTSKDDRKGSSRLCLIRMILTCNNRGLVSAGRESRHWRLGERVLCDGDLCTTVVDSHLLHIDTASIAALGSDIV